MNEGTVQSLSRERGLASNEVEGTVQADLSRGPGSRQSMLCYEGTFDSPGIPMGGGRGGGGGGGARGGWGGGG